MSTRYYRYWHELTNKARRSSAVSCQSMVTRKHEKKENQKIELKSCRLRIHGKQWKQAEAHHVGNNNNNTRIRCSIHSCWQEVCTKSRAWPQQHTEGSNNLTASCLFPFPKPCVQKRDNTVVAGEKSSHLLVSRHCVCTGTRERFVSLCFGSIFVSFFW